MVNKKIPQSPRLLHKLLLSTFLWASLASLSADDYTVSNTDDSGVGSLRQAIFDANARSGSDTITFEAALDGQEIRLTSGALVISDTTGRTLVDASGSAGGIVLSGDADGSNSASSSDSRVIEVEDSAIAEIRNVVVSEGVSSYGMDSWLAYSGEDGGGILNAGDLTMIDCEIRGNTAGGGGDSLGSNLGQIAVAGGGGSGGGIYNSGVLRLTDCQVSDNTAGDGGDATFGGSVLNVYGGTGGSGGGIYNEAVGSVILLRTIVHNNHSGDGGFADGKTSGANTYGGNGNGGGAIMNRGVLNITESLISRNTSGDGGRAIRGDTSTSGNAGEGGGIRSTGGAADLRIYRGAVADNMTGLTPDGITSGPGGGLAISSGGGAIIRNCTVHGNITPGTSGRGGAGLYVHGASTFLSNCTIVENRAATDGGGILHWLDLFSVTIENSIISNNLADNSGADLKGEFHVVTGKNFVGNVEGGTGLDSPYTGDPVLSESPTFGGLSKIFIPSSSSAAVDGALITANTPTVDTRGMDRPLGRGYDIGSVERLESRPDVMIGFSSVSGNQNLNNYYSGGFRQQIKFTILKGRRKRFFITAENDSDIDTLTFRSNRSRRELRSNTYLITDTRINVTAVVRHSGYTMRDLKPGEQHLFVTELKADSETERRRIKQRRYWTVSSGGKFDRGVSVIRVK